MSSGGPSDSGKGTESQKHTLAETHVLFFQGEILFVGKEPESVSRKSSANVSNDRNS